jgi:hypothetical protein
MLPFCGKRANEFSDIPMVGTHVNYGIETWQ